MVKKISEGNFDKWGGEVGTPDLKKFWAKTAAKRKAERDKQRSASAKKARDAAQRKGITQDKDGTYYAEGSDFPLNAKNARYILGKLDQGVHLHRMIDEFPELEEMIDEIMQLHGTENFDEVESILINDLNDIIDSDPDADDDDQFDEAGEQQLKVTKVDQATGNVTAVNPTTNQPTQIKASDLKPDPTKPGSFTTSMTSPKGVDAGATITAKLEDDIAQEMCPSSGSESPISGDEDHDEMSKLLVMRLRRLAGL